MSDRQDVDGRAVGEGARARLLAAMPVVERRIELAGIPTAVLEGGDGPPMVLLHSGGEFAALWMRVLPDLVRTHRVLAPDLPGHGASEAGGPLDADHLVAWLGALIEATCSSPPVLVGRGLGGAVAARYAVRHGDRLDRLVLVESFGLDQFNPAPSFGTALDRYLEEPTERTRDELFEQCFADLDGLRERVGERWTPVAAYALDRARASGMRAALATLMPRVGMPVIDPSDLDRIAVPVRLIWGRDDLQVRLPVGEAASDRHGWPLWVIDGAGDDPPMERPEAFVRALREALDPATPATTGHRAGAEGRR